MSFALWLTGLPGSGKSAIARELVQQLHERAIEVSVLESDVMRTQLTPYPRYDEEDRAFFYGWLVEFGAMLANKGRPVLFDATANKRAYRDAARKTIARFAEVYVDTPLEVCAARDPKGLYGKQQTTTLPGAQAPYEPPPAPELVVHGAVATPAESAGKIVALLVSRGWV